jgi:hypothetical protein
MDVTLRANFSQGGPRRYRLEFAPVSMTPHWIILLSARTQLYSFHHWKGEPTTQLFTGSFDRASRSLFRVEAKPNHGREE